MQLDLEKIRNKTNIHHSICFEVSFFEKTIFYTTRRRVSGSDSKMENSVSIQVKSVIKSKANECQHITTQNNNQHTYENYEKIN